MIGQEKLKAMLKVSDFNIKINRIHVRVMPQKDLIREGSAY